MIVIRDVFSLKFGSARPVKALMQESKKIMPAEMVKNSRILFDLIGPSYTMVMEYTCANLTAWEKEMSAGGNEDEWREWYQKFIPHVNSSYREVFSIVD